MNTSFLNTGNDSIEESPPPQTSATATPPVAESLPQRPVTETAIPSSVAAFIAPPPSFTHSTGYSPSPALQQGMNPTRPSFIDTQQAFSFNSKQETNHYEKPLITVDVVIFSLIHDKLSVLLLERHSEPFKGRFSIPGGFMNVGETMDEAAQRWLLQKTGGHDIYLEQLAAFGGVHRDPRARVITISYYALLNVESLGKVGLSNPATWHAIDNLPELAFDHKRIITTAINRVKDRIETSNIAFELLPEKFTLTQLQKVYEIILNTMLDKRNFRKKIVASGMVEKCKGETKMDGYHRPAQLFKATGKVFASPIV